MKKLLKKIAPLALTASMLAPDSYAQGQALGQNEAQTEHAEPLESFDYSGFHTLVDSYSLLNGFKPACPDIKKPPYRAHPGKPRSSALAVNVDAWNEWNKSNLPEYCWEEADKALAVPTDNVRKTIFELKTYWDVMHIGKDERYYRPVTTPVGFHPAYFKFGKFNFGAGGINFMYHPVLTPEHREKYRPDFALDLISMTMDIGYSRLFGRNISFSLIGTKALGDPPKGLGTQPDYGSLVGGISFNLKK